MVVYSFFAYGVFTMLLVMVIFLTSSHADFVNAYNAYFQGGVAKVFSDAADGGLHILARASPALARWSRYSS